MRNFVILVLACFVLTACGDKESSGDGNKLYRDAHKLKPADESKNKAIRF